jgi:hypothetical protein
VCHLDVIEARHEISGYLGRLLFGDGIGRILLPGLKNIFHRAPVFGCATVTEQLHGESWDRQHDEDREDQKAHGSEYQESFSPVHGFVQLLYGLRIFASL